jgi:gas vesicle protein
VSQLQTPTTTQHLNPRPMNWLKCLKGELRRLLLKIISDLKEDTNKQINEVRKSIQDLDKKVSNIEEKYSKDM